MAEHQLSDDFVARARKTQSPGEMAALAREEGIELEPERAEAVYAHFHSTEELSDEDLDAVSGGGLSWLWGEGEADDDGLGFIQPWTCPACGNTGALRFRLFMGAIWNGKCFKCGHFEHLSYKLD